MYLVFERCSQSLKDLMKSLGPPGTPLPLPSLYTCLAQLVAALRFVHNMGVVHRDIKLENLLVSRVGGRLQVQISNFASFIMNLEFMIHNHESRLHKISHDHDS